MRPPSHLLLPLAAAAALLAAAPSRPPSAVRLGPDRGPDAYAEQVPGAKAVLLTRINSERVAAGVRPLAYDLLGARVGDEFCLDAAARGSVGHWDTKGRAPYLRWALAGGFDAHAQNFASESRSGYRFTEPPEVLLLAAHARFMAEVPPDDGHRKTVLDPRWTHVGIGFAVVGGELRMTEEYSQRVLEWVELPGGPVKAGESAAVTMKLPKGWSVAAVEIAHEPPPRPLTLAEVRARGSYGYPPAIRKLRPTLAPGMRWADGSDGSFGASTGGRFTVRVPLDAGPGSYYLLVFAGPGDVIGRRLHAVAAPMVLAQ